MTQARVQDKWFTTRVDEGSDEGSRQKFDGVRTGAGWSAVLRGEVRSELSAVLRVELVFVRSDLARHR